MVRVVKVLGGPGLGILPLPIGEFGGRFLRGLRFTAVKPALVDDL